MDHSRKGLNPVFRQSWLFQVCLSYFKAVWRNFFTSITVFTIDNYSNCFYFRSFNPVIHCFAKFFEWQLGINSQNYIISLICTFPDKIPCWHTAYLIFLLDTWCFIKAITRFYILRICYKVYFIYILICEISIIPNVFFFLVFAMFRANP